MLRLVRKYTFFEAELDEGLQEYRPPFWTEDRSSVLYAPEPQKKKWRDHTSRLNALVEDFDIDTEPLDYLFCFGELLSSV